MAARMRMASGQPTSLRLVHVMILVLAAAVTGSGSLDYANHFSSPPKELYINRDSGDRFSQLAEAAGSPVIKLNHVFNQEKLHEVKLKPTDWKFQEILVSHDLARQGHRSGGASSRSQERFPAEERDPLFGLRGRNLKAKSVTSNFALQGGLYPSGLYRAVVSLGTPEQTFNVAIDTGSSLLWVNCYPCQACTKSDTLQHSTPFDAGKSSTSKSVTCTSPWCAIDSTVWLSGQNSSNCVSPDEACKYGSGYADGSATQGTLLEDMVWLSTEKNTRPVGLPMVFGCGNFQQGTFATGAGWTIFDAVDGLMGLGRGDFSIATVVAKSQAGLGIRNIFTFCLGTGFSGGLLAFGDSHVPQKRVVYTPLTPHPEYYLVKLVNVLVGGHPLSVPEVAYPEYYGGNAIFDCGATYTLLPTSLQKAIMNMIKLKVGLKPAIDNPQDGPYIGALCYDETDSWPVSVIGSRFPNLNLQFGGRGIFLNLPPPAYTFVVEDETPRQICTRLIPSPNAPFILIGDVWMRNFLFVHDLEKQRIGWTPMQCA